MNFAVWEPHYLEILDYFGFDRGRDEEAARLLASLMTRDNLLSLTALTCGNDVTVCGNAPCLKGRARKNFRDCLCSRCRCLCPRCTWHPPGCGLHRP